MLGEHAAWTQHDVEGLRFGIADAEEGRRRPQAEGRVGRQHPAPRAAPHVEGEVDAAGHVEAAAQRHTVVRDLPACHAAGAGLGPGVRRAQLDAVHAATLRRGGAC